MHLCDFCIRGNNQTANSLALRFSDGTDFQRMALATPHIQHAISSFDHAAVQQAFDRDPRDIRVPHRRHFRIDLAGVLIEEAVEPGEVAR